MENLQNLLKLKEAEIEKLNNLRNALKRKVVELNDSLSLKEMKISSLKEDLQQKTAELESNQQIKTNPQDRPTQSPLAISSIEEKLDRILDTLQQLGSNMGPSTGPSRAMLHETPPSHASNAPPSHPNLRERLKPISSEAPPSPSSPSPPRQPMNSKPKMISPIVNAAKIQDISSPEYSSNSSDHSPSPPPRAPPRPLSSSRDQFNEIPEPEDYSMHPSQGVEFTESSSSHSPKSNGSTQQVEMGQYGIPTIPYPEDGQVKCPKCGGTKLQESENKKKIVMYNPRKYGKKIGCNSCRFEWEWSY